MVVFNVNIGRRFLRNGSLTAGSRARQSEAVRAALRWADAQTWRRRLACEFWQRLARGAQHESDGAGHPRQALGLLQAGGCLHRWSLQQVIILAGLHPDCALAAAEQDHHFSRRHRPAESARRAAESGMGEALR